jgi:Putative transposase/Transposase zinc-binding domain
MAGSVAEVLRQFGAAYLRSHTLSTPQAKAWRGIVACRTAALGGQLLACDACGHSHWQYHSCRNRHCPSCGMRAKDAWLQGRLLGQDGHWHTPTRKPDFLFPVQALSRVFRGKFMAALAQAHQAGCIERDPQGEEGRWRDRQCHLYQHDWVVYAKTPLGGPAQVLEYLSRYTHRTAISNERIRSINGDDVTFTVRSDNNGGKRLLRLDGPEFVRRFMLHILPTGIKRIRHFGVLASSCKGVKLAAARAALQMPASNPRATESAHGFMARVAKIDVGLCPCCGLGRLRVTAVLAGLLDTARGGAAPGANMGALKPTAGVPRPHWPGRLTRSRSRQTAQTSNLPS